MVLGTDGHDMELCNVCSWAVLATSDDTIRYTISQNAAYSWHKHTWCLVLMAFGSIKEG